MSDEDKDALPEVLATAVETLCDVLRDETTYDRRAPFEVQVGDAKFLLTKSPTKVVIKVRIDGSELDVVDFTAPYEAKLTRIKAEVLRLHKLGALVKMKRADRAGRVGGAMPSDRLDEEEEEEREEEEATGDEVIQTAQCTRSVFCSRECGHRGRCNRKRVAEAEEVKKSDFHKRSSVAGGSVIDVTEDEGNGDTLKGDEEATSHSTPKATSATSTPNKKLPVTSEVDLDVRAEELLMRLTSAESKARHELYLNIRHELDGGTVDIDNEETQIANMREARRRAMAEKPERTETVKLREACERLRTARATVNEAEGDVLRIVRELEGEDTTPANKRAKK